MKTVKTQVLTSAVFAFAFPKIACMHFSNKNLLCLSGFEAKFSFLEPNRHPFSLVVLDNIT